MRPTDAAVRATPFRGATAEGDRAMLGTLARNWWVLALRGAFAVLFGVAAWAWPGLTLAALVFLFGAYALVDGAFAVAAGPAARDGDRRWWSEVLVGVAGIALGILTFAWPDLTALVLLSLIAAWAVVTGVLEIAAAVRLREAIANGWLLGLAGLASVLFGVLLVLFPGAGALGLIWLIGAYAVLVGALLITLGLRLRGMGAAGATVEIGGPGAAQPVA